MKNQTEKTTTAQHTPGPWTCETIDGSIIGARNANSCSLVIVSKLGYQGVQTPANARLIAAAPDLLAACKILLDLAGADSLASLELEESDRATLTAVSEFIRNL